LRLAAVATKNTTGMVPFSRALNNCKPMIDYENNFSIGFY